jgi:hypothetical protein
MSGRTISLIEDGLHAQGSGVGFGGLIGAERAKAQKARATAGVNKFRAENPDDFHTWTTKYGCVVQFWGMRVYYGTCQTCKGLVTARRDVSKYKAGRTQIGRWPKYCQVCRELKAGEHNAAARKRMAQLRKERNALQAEQLHRANERRAKSGLLPLPVPRQGVPGEEAQLRRREREEEHYDLYHHYALGDLAGCENPNCLYNSEEYRNA